MADNNMELWDQVCTTDPAITRRVNQRGGFTAIDAQHQIKRATELWGPYGKAWGLFNVSYGYVTAPDGAPVEIWIEATFRYPGGGFPISGDMAWKPGNDCRKKLMTDVTTKALSKLGFNSDVFEGQFDDDKYVQEQKTEPKKKQRPEFHPVALEVKQMLIDGFNAEHLSDAYCKETLDDVIAHKQDEKYLKELHKAVQEHIDAAKGLDGKAELF